MVLIFIIVSLSKLRDLPPVLLFFLLILSKSEYRIIFILLFFNDNIMYLLC